MATRFVILCLARTGSTNLVALLDSHPGIRCHGEILNLEHPDAAGTGSIVGAGATTAIEHAERVLAATPDAATGFKLPRSAIRTHPGIIRIFERDPELRIVRLTRENHLALLLSRRLLRATLVSQSTYGSYGATAVAIDPGECRRRLERIERFQQELDALGAGHPSVRVSFEELAAGKRLDEVQRFLGVEPAALSSPYRRLRQRSLAESIENWEELRAELDGTVFARFLDE
jgi:hypothetical protein